MWRRLADDVEDQNSTLADREEEANRKGAPGTEYMSARIFRVRNNFFFGGRIVHSSQFTTWGKKKKEGGGLEKRNG